MSTLPDLYERLGAQGDHAGADAVVARALTAAHGRPSPVPLTFDTQPPRARRLTLALSAAVLTIALIAVPVVLSRTSPPSRASVQPPGPPYPPAASATAAQLAAMHWSQIAKAPIPLTGTSNQIVAWAGNELIVFGQSRQDDSHGAGAVYVPATNRWHVLPRAPLRGDWFFQVSWVWTGRELVVFPTTVPDTGKPQGEAYSPRTNSWRVLAPAPLCSVAEPGIAWTGRSIVLAGGWDVNGSQCSDARSAATASYDPLTDRWTPGPRVPERPGDRLVETKLVWAGGRVVAVVGTQRNFAGTATAGTTPTSASTSTSTVAAKPLTAADPVVRVYSCTPGTSAWHALGDLTAGTSGEAPLDHWQPSANGSRIAFPPSLRFCGEGTMGPCSLAGVQPGSVYDLDTGHRVALALPKLAYGSNVDATAFTGDALVAMIHDSSTSSALVWDLTTGHRVELPQPPETVLVSVWTGREVIALAIPNGQGDAIGLRLGP